MVLIEPHLKTLGPLKVVWRIGSLSAMAVASNAKLFS